MAKSSERDRRAELIRLRDKTKKLALRLKAMEDDEGLYELVSANENVKNRIISDYLTALSKRNNPSLINTGFSALTPVPRPKNLADAKRLADKIIKS